MKKVLITICLFLLAPSVSFAVDQYEATGFSDTNANGIFEQTTTYCSQPRIQNANGYYVRYSYEPGGCTDNLWYMYDNSNNQIYYSLSLLGAWITGGGSFSNYTPPAPSTPTSTLPSWIGLPWLIGNATSTQINTTTQAFEISYTVNTTTQEMFNALTDHTQSNLAYGLGIFLIVAGGFLWTLRSRK